MKPIKRLKLIPFACFQAFLGLLIGLLCGILYAFGGLLIDIGVSLGLLNPESMSTPGLSVGTLLAFGALLGMPLIFAGLGFVLGIVEAVLYNLYAKWFGGLKLDFD
ncbi:hypothetical protein EHW67_10675 [Arenibacter aquaticus]|uniref:DUF3566 domain-containing protein n=1 Tax=Arenibacter aquaticus TaxID=2489054 RepID=A0A3S0CKL6_9FLAO|nr:hypothetical protein [Arenibacter aquaticus]RTE53471.1 hypothetical protein EHW67_10675 [Arenibacter aquaticus]